MERRSLTREILALVPPAFEERGFLAAFTERTGGASRTPFATLNLAFHTGDRPAPVRRNRGLATRALGLPPFATAAQPHSTRVVRVGQRRAGAGFADPDAAVPDADILAVSRPGIPVAVLTADCVPIALASPRQRLLVVVHAGWRGMAAGVIERALALFERPAELLAGLGPAIGPCHYEVGEDVALAVSAGSEAEAVAQRRDGRVFLDLGATAERALRSSGVRRIDRAEECTACYEDRFFSHRRDGKRTGRQALIAALR